MHTNLSMPHLRHALNRLFVHTQRIVPFWVFQPGFRPDGIRRIVLDRADAPLPGDLKSGEVVNVSLNRSAFLVKDINLPSKVGGKAVAAAELKLTQQLPNQGSGMLCRLGNFERAGDQITLTAFVIKQRAVDQLSDRFHRQGVLLRTLRVDGMSGCEPLVDNRRMTDRAAVSWMGGALLVVLALWLLHVLHVRADNARAVERIQELESAKIELAERAVEISQAKSSQVANHQRLTEDLNRLKQGRGRTKLLLELTEILPNDTWLTEFNLAAQTLRISGHSSHDIPELIQSLLSQTWVQSAKLDGPIVMDRLTGQSRFDIVLGLQAE
ncbi:PilN domain-containing protein [Ruegeria sp. HKCCD8929]|uniref:PilN domain-containing protein n=1 Tax=Ruegeria sp. HKCCD8929 TaxID=2683006 RepID=UPI0014891DA0|nr:PilN domain-containing protein [Ruegeria sp. HKCCD8929]